MRQSVEPRTTLDIRVVTSLDALEEHASAWDQLALSSPDGLPMLSHAWVASFLETCNPHGRPWRCLFAYDGGDLVGVLPVLRTRGWPVARLNGPVDTHTEFAYPLLATGSAAGALDVLTAALAELEPGRWMHFHAVRDTSPLLPALPVLEPRMRVLLPRSCPGSFIDTSGSFDEFQSSLSSSFRRSLRGAGRKAAQVHGIEYDVVSGADAGSPELFDDFLRVEAAGWKGQAGSAIGCDPDRVAFYAALARRLARRGWLEWNLLRFDGTVVAAHFGVRFGTSLLLPKGGYDESVAHYAPGNLLFWEVFSRSFADGTDEVNFLTDMPWMKIWRMRQSTYQDVIISPRSAVATLASRVTAAEPRRRASEYAHRYPQLVDGIRRARARLRGLGQM